MSVELKIKKLTKTAKLPIRGTTGAGCYDFFVDRIERVAPDKVTVYLGLAVEVPEGYSLMIKPRSSFGHKNWVQQNSPAEIDSDYRGEIMIKYQAFPIETAGLHLSYPDFIYNIGDRCAQGRLEKLVGEELIEVDELGSTERGTGGFGSTGS